MKKQLAPDRILQLGLAFWGSKTLLSAIELGLFTELAKGPRDKDALRVYMNLHTRSVGDFLDALVALGMLDRNKPSYIGGLLEMANARLYGFWGALTEGLRSGTAQNEAKQGGNPFDA